MRLTTLGLIGALGTALLLILLFPPFNLRPLAAVALTPLLYLMAQEPRWRRRFGWGWLAGAVYWGVTCGWIQAVLQKYGNLNLGLSILAIVLFAVAKGLHMAVFASLGAVFLKRRWGLLLIPAFWTGLERTHANLGFTWLQLGNAGIEMGIPLRLAPYAGVYGVSFVLASLATGLVWVLLRRPRQQLAWLAPLALLVVLPGIPADERTTASAVALQPALSDDSMSTRDEYERGLKRLAFSTLSEATNPNLATPQLLLWPETPGPFYYYRDSYFRDTVTQVARLASTPFLFGSVASTARNEPLNSGIMLDSDGRLLGRYDKVHLVPFGEFVPPLFGWVNKISAEAGEYAPGERVVVFPTAHGTVGAFICYESAFPHFVRAFVNEGAQVLVNLTNDGYFLRGRARGQHLLLARMRAVENRRWLLRATNDGTTAAISPAGLLHDVFPPFEPRTGRLYFNWIRETTLYTRIGDVFAWTCLALALALRVAAEVPQYG